MREDDFDQKEVAEGVADCLIDKAGKGAEGGKGGRLGRGLRFVFREALERKIGEDYSTVAVGFEVNTHIKLGCRMMQMLDAGRSAHNGEFQIFGYVASRGAVGIGGLDDTDFEFFREAGRAGEVRDEQGGEGGNAVAVEETEGPI